MVQEIKNKNLQEIVKNFGNVLETVTIPAYPVIQEIKDAMMKYGAMASLMSGSGPTVFGLFTTQAEAEKAYDRFRHGRESELARQIYLTNFYNPRD